MGDGEKGRQFDAAEFLQRLVHGGDLVVRQPVGAAMAGEVFGDGRDPSAAALVHTLDVGKAHATYPVGIAAESADANVTPAGKPGHVEHVQHRPEQQIDPQGGKLPAGDLAGATGELWLPGGADGHGVGQRRETVGDASIRVAVALVIHGDKEGHAGATGREGQGLQGVGQA